PADHRSLRSPIVRPRPRFALGRTLRRNSAIVAKARPGSVVARWSKRPPAPSDFRHRRPFLSRNEDFVAGWRARRRLCFSSARNWPRLRVSIRRRPFGSHVMSQFAYRPCVGIALFNPEGLVFIGRRRNKRPNDQATAGYEWQMPQGGIDL